jgi:hypothetical protein
MSVRARAGRGGGGVLVCTVTTWWHSPCTRLNVCGQFRSAAKATASNNPPSRPYMPAGNRQRCIVLTLLCEDPRVTQDPKRKLLRVVRKSRCHITVWMPCPSWGHRGCFCVPGSRKKSVPCPDSNCHTLQQGTCNWWAQHQ